MFLDEILKFCLYGISRSSNQLIEPEQEKSKRLEDLVKPEWGKADKQRGENIQLDLCSADTRPFFFSADQTHSAATQPRGGPECFLTVPGRGRQARGEGNRN
ncbi:hypothetical protein AVEN_242599-1 [Araneus ventricosus]|uniref:Uncharacterized protein n=1 Tax=Araneus ventricosus TaxID=182803 RepID=A0A4Y2EPG1_ARAVE|nr:hypothetical protein AVEN_242599-1 [Araneus ventricosus]